MYRRRPRSNMTTEQRSKLAAKIKKTNRLFTHLEVEWYGANKILSSSCSSVCNQFNGTHLFLLHAA